MGDFDTTIQNPTTSTGGITSGGGTTPVPANKPSIEDFFNRKLTRAQVAQEFGQTGLDLFDKANTDEDDGISQSEMDSYNNPAQKADDLTGKSGKRTATGGVYTVVKGDTLSKIADDFGISLIKLYNDNKSVVGKNMNRIEIGMQLKINSSSTPSTSSSDKSTSDKTQTTQQGQTKDLKSALADYMKRQKSDVPQIFLGMTREQAEKRGGESLRLFNQYAGESADKLGAEQYKSYQKTLKYTSFDQVASGIPAVLGKDNGKLSRTEMGEVLDAMIVMGGKATGIGQTQASKKLSGKIRDKIVQYDSYDSPPTKEKIAEHADLLMGELKTSVQDEIKNKGDIYKSHYDRLKAGKFTEFELASGLKEGDELTEEQIQKLAETAVKAEHIYPVLQTLAEAMKEQGENGEKDNTILLLIMRLGDKFFENEDVLAVAQMTGLMSVIDKAKQQFAANEIATNSSLDLQNMDEGVAAMYTATIVDNADAEAVRVFAENHSESIDLINKVVEQVIQNSNNEDKNNALRQVISDVNNKVGYTTESTKNSRTTDPTPSYTTSQIREESQRYYANLGITNPTTAEEVEQQQSRQSVNKLKTEIGPAPVIYSPARIRQLSRDYNNSIGKFDTLSKEDQEAVKKYLDNAKGQPQAIMSIMLAGNEKVQLFLVKEKYITIEDITRNIKSFPANYDGLSDTIKDALYSNVKASVTAGTLKPEQMTDGERKMYEYANQD